jgi:hypothetical protein
MMVVVKVLVEAVEAVVMLTLVLVEHQLLVAEVLMD